jgi:hypothetical protein
MRDQGFWGLEYAQRRGWIPKPKQENAVKYQIRKESNRYDPTLVMYNIYKCDPLTPNGVYIGGDYRLETAMRMLENRRHPVSEVVYEVED